MTATVDALLDGSTAQGVFAWRGFPDFDVEAEFGDAGWSVWHLDTSSATSSSDVYDVLQRDWELPDWFGRNLDALWDVLADRLTAPTVLIWDGLGALSEHDPDFAVVLLGLLRDASTQAESFSVVVRPDPDGTGEVVLSELDGLL